MLRWFPRLQVATACFSCRPLDLNFLDPNFIFMYMHYDHCHRATVHLELNMLYYYYYHYHRISHFSASVGKHSPILGCVMNRIRLDGLIHNLKFSYNWTCLIFMDPCTVVWLSRNTKMQLVIEFIIPKFIEGLTCFERHVAHHQEL